MDAKKVYESPEAEVIRFDDGDVITASDTVLPPVSGSSVTNLY